MKPFLGVDITNDKKNEKFNGDRFIVANTSVAQIKSLEESSEEQFDLLMNKTKLPLPVRIISGICGFVSLLGIFIIITAFFKDESELTPEMLMDMPWIFIVTGICIAVWITCTVFGHLKSKKVLEGEEYSKLTAETEKLTDSISEELCIPSDAVETEVISVTYKMKNGEIKPVTSGMALSPYTNFVMRAFCADGILYLADWESKYAIPFSEIRSIHTVKKAITVPMWYKDEEPNKGEYKKYKLKQGNIGTVTSKSYHILEFNHGGEAWGVYFPCYELPVFERLTGLRAEE